LCGFWKRIGNLRAVEELAEEGVSKVRRKKFATRHFSVGLDEGAADVAFAGLVGGHAAIVEDEAGHAMGREVVDEVLHPGEAGVALGRDAELPAHVVVFAEPVGVVCGGVVEAQGKEAALLVQRVAKGQVAPPKRAGLQLRPVRAARRLRVES